MAQMNRRDFLTKCLAAGVSGFVLPGRASGRRAAGRPNVVLIVSDDQGYADASCYDHPAEVSTPSIDRLAQDGVRLTDGYASAYVCAPTRAGLLTGRYQQRFGFYTGGDSRIGLPLSELTVADLLKKQGYATAVVGKWHVGIEPEYRPLRRGFDEFYGFLGHGAHDYFDLKITDEYTSIYRNNQPINDTGYLTHNLARQAVSFIERHHKQPFFLYLPFNAVHWPLQAPRQDIERFDTGDKSRDTYLAMLACMDEAIGRVLNALKQAGVDENTLVIFFSDNGGARKNCLRRWNPRALYCALAGKTAERNRLFAAGHQPGYHAHHSVSRRCGPARRPCLRWKEHARRATGRIEKALARGSVLGRWDRPVGGSSGQMETHISGRLVGTVQSGNRY